MNVQQAQRYTKGRPIPALLFSGSGRFVPSGLRGRAKPVVFLVGQVHGNEPASGEAMLAVARALATGELKPLLERMPVVILPRANPDGAPALTNAAEQLFSRALARDAKGAGYPDLWLRWRRSRRCHGSKKRGKPYWFPPVTSLRSARQLRTAGNRVVSLRYLPSC